MTIYEYKVLPAPAKGARARGVKGPGARLAHGFETLLNDMARDGWEFQRAETLPSEERQGLTHSSTGFRTFLVFRRPRPGDIAEFDPRPADLDETPTDDDPDNPDEQDTGEDDTGKE